MATVRRNISMSVELDAKLTEQALKEDRKISAIVKRALEMYLYAAGSAKESTPALKGE